MAVMKNELQVPQCRLAVRLGIRYRDILCFATMIHLTAIQHAGCKLEFGRVKYTKAMYAGSISV